MRVVWLVRLLNCRFDELEEPGQICLIARVDSFLIIFETPLGIAAAGASEGDPAQRWTNLPQGQKEQRNEQESCFIR